MDDAQLEGVLQRRKEFTDEVAAYLYAHSELTNAKYALVIQCTCGIHRLASVRRIVDLALDVLRYYVSIVSLAESDTPLPSEDPVIDALQCIRIWSHNIIAVSWDAESRHDRLVVIRSRLRTLVQALHPTPYTKLPRDGETYNTRDWCFFTALFVHLCVVSFFPDRESRVVQWLDGSTLRTDALTLYQARVALGMIEKQCTEDEMDTNICEDVEQRIAHLVLHMRHPLAAMDDEPYVAPNRRLRTGLYTASVMPSLCALWKYTDMRAWIATFPSPRDGDGDYELDDDASARLMAFLGDRAKRTDRDTYPERTRVLAARLLARPSEVTRVTENKSINQEYSMEAAMHGINTKHLNRQTGALAFSGMEAYRTAFVAALQMYVVQVPTALLTGAVEGQVQSAYKSLLPILREACMMVLAEDALFRIHVQFFTQSHLYCYGGDDDDYRRLHERPLIVYMSTTKQFVLRRDGTCIATSDVVAALHAFIMDHDKGAELLDGRI